MPEKLMMQVSHKVLRLWQEAGGTFDRLRFCKRHPGISNVGVVRLPKLLLSAISSTIQNFDYPRLSSKVPWFVERFRSASLPLEDGDIQRIKRNLEVSREFQILRELDDQERSSESTGADRNATSNASNFDVADRNKLKMQAQKKLNKMLNMRLNRQPAVNYNEGSELDMPIVYLLTRMAPNYAALYRVLSEVKQRAMPDWRPSSVLDYSSRCGTTCWVADEIWPSSIVQNLLCDTYSQMHDLSTLVFKSGNEQSDRMRFRGVTCRTYLPLYLERSFDLVVSAYSLIDLPNLKTRLQTIATLWQATAPGGYLVLIERGGKSGFQAIAEARAFLINLFANLSENAQVTAGGVVDVSERKNSDQTEFSGNNNAASEANIEDNAEQVRKDRQKKASRSETKYRQVTQHFRHVFAGELVAPCPHSQACPRFAVAHGAGRIPCSFPVQFYSLELSRDRAEVVQTEEFSYAVFRKAENEMEHKHLLHLARSVASSENDSQTNAMLSPTENEAVHNWPRVIQPVLLRHHHSHVKLCCPDGNIRHMIISQSKSHPCLYKCTRYCEAGDQIPATFSKTDASNVENCESKNQSVSDNANSTE